MIKKESAAYWCGRLVANARNLSMMTQEQLADAADITPSTYSRIERGVVLPDLYTMIKLEKALGWEPGSLCIHVHDLYETSIRNTTFDGIAP